MRVLKLLLVIGQRYVVVSVGTTREKSELYFRASSAPLKIGFAVSDIASKLNVVVFAALACLAYLVFARPQDTAPPDDPWFG